jgi:hypothetical protein
VGQVLAAALKIEGATLRQFGEWAEINHSNLSRLMAGRRLSPSNLDRLYHVLRHRVCRQALLFAHLQDELERALIKPSVVSLSLPATQGGADATAEVGQFLSISIKPVEASARYEIELQRLMESVEKAIHRRS